MHLAYDDRALPIPFTSVIPGWASRDTRIRITWNDRGDGGNAVELSKSHHGHCNYRMKKDSLTGTTDSHKYQLLMLRPETDIFLPTTHYTATTILPSHVGGIRTPLDQSSHGLLQHLYLPPAPSMAPLALLRSRTLLTDDLHA